MKEAADFCEMMRRKGGNGLTWIIAQDGNAIHRFERIEKIIITEPKTVAVKQTGKRCRTTALAPKRIMAGEEPHIYEAAALAPSQIMAGERQYMTVFAEYSSGELSREALGMLLEAIGCGDEIFRFPLEEVLENKAGQ